MVRHQKNAHTHRYLQIGLLVKGEVSVHVSVKMDGNIWYS